MKVLDNWKLHKTMNGYNVAEVMVYRVHEGPVNAAGDRRGEYILLHEDGAQDYGSFLIPAGERNVEIAIEGSRWTGILRPMPSYEESLADLAKYSPGKAGELFRHVLEDNELLPGTVRGLARPGIGFGGR